MYPDTVNARRWAGRSSSRKHDRNLWQPPEPTPVDVGRSISAYSNPTHIIGYATAEQLRSSAIYFSNGRPSSGLHVSRIPHRGVLSELANEPLQAIAGGNGNRYHTSRLLYTPPPLIPPISELPADAERAVELSKDLNYANNLIAGLRERGVTGHRNSIEDGIVLAELSSINYDKSTSLNRSEISVSPARLVNGTSALVSDNAQTTSTGDHALAHNSESSSILSDQKPWGLPFARGRNLPHFEQNSDFEALPGTLDSREERIMLDGKWYEDSCASWPINPYAQMTVGEGSRPIDGGFESPLPEDHEEWHDTEEWIA